MSEQKSFSFLPALLVLLPLLFLLAVDLTAMLEGYSFFRAISHFSFAIFSAQLICQIVFWRGDICNGQRSRLVKVNLWFMLFWAIWFIVSLFSNYHYILMDIMAICGIITSITVWGQPQEEKLRNKLLLIGLICISLGMLIYLWVFFLFPPLSRLQFSPLSQLVTGVILAYILLIVAKNRLQNFIALLPLIAVSGLILNVFFALAVLFYYQAELVHSMLYYILYFILHLVLVGFWAYPIWYNRKLNYIALLFMLELSVCFPLLLIM